MPIYLRTPTHQAGGPGGPQPPTRCDLTDLPADGCAHCRPAPNEPQPARTKPVRPESKLAPCGTRSAYQRHLRRREPIDEPCRIANTRADRRLRTTGSTSKASETPTSVPALVLTGDERAAALAVVGWAHDAADARLLLDALGILTAPDR